MNEDHTTLAVGDRAPDFVLPDPSGRFLMFYERTQGLPVVLLLVPEAASATGAAVLRAFRCASADFAAAGLDVFCVCDALPAQAAGAEGAVKGPLIWWDKAGKILDAYLAGLGIDDQSQAYALLLDANQRVLDLVTGQDARLAEQVLAFYRQLPAPPKPAQHRATAPVLMVPRLLSRAWCERLRGFCPGRGVGPAAVVRPPQSASVSLAAVLDPASLRSLRAVLGRRLAPELFKAFSFTASRLGDLTLTSDGAEGPSGSSFEFVVDLSPKAGSEGGADTAGGFVFPEYDGAAYCPPSGGGLVYATGLLIRRTSPLGVARCFLTGRLQS